MAFKPVALMALLLACIMVPVFGYPRISLADKAALMKVREAVKHKGRFPPIACGNSSIGPQSVAYIGCDSKGHVTDFYCNRLAMGGVISPYIGNLTNLVNLTIYLCGMGGKVPNELGRLSKLKLLNLEANNFKGTIPAGITKLTQLKYLSLAINAFTGFIPAAIGSMKNLINASFSTNMLRGTIPESIRNLTRLETFYINRNYIMDPMVRQNGHPGCNEAQKNCFFGKKLPCKGKFQRTKEECDAFYKNSPK